MKRLTVGLLAGASVLAMPASASASRSSSDARSEVGAPAEGAWNGYEREVSFTDGRRVMILVGDEGGARRAVTLDLRSGAERWTWDVPDGWVLRAVDGRLVAEADGDLVGLR
jgi:hypothetical protein